MIGVIAKPEEHDVVAEFFELFKTPWEFYRSHRRYDVVLCAGDGNVYGASARLILVYAGRTIPVDAEVKTPIASQGTNTMLCYRGSRVPLYGKSLTFREGGRVLTDEATGQSAAYVVRSSDGVLVRIGYDLFGEIRAALTVGQPPENASIPAVEMHIALLRDLIIEYAPPLVEIPPVPDGYRFIACLTHDVDHASIRRHKWDHTMFGFLYRAVLGSVVNVFRGRASVRDLLANWVATLKLPLVHAGLAKDFWYEFDRYLEFEAGLGSTFFVIPFKNYPGRTREGQAPVRRASRYEARDIESHIRRLTSAGCEVGVHGIDAWCDSSKGREELQQVSRMTGDPDIGVRMHWLYVDEKSPATLEKAGFAYDSTSGYNETVGYRAGTTQVFKPLGAARLLELPLHVMDTALFYPSHLNLRPREARRRVEDIIDNVVRFGGTVTVNWHDRSIAPERLWGAFYVHLIEELKRKNAWFATAQQAVAWFRKRRSAVFEAVSRESSVLRAKVSVDTGDDLPGLRLRIHKPRMPRQCGAVGSPAPEGYVELALNRSIDTRVPI